MHLSSVCLLIQGNASERDLERATHIFSDTTFILDGHKYCVEQVSRDEQNRLMLQARKEGASMEHMSNGVGLGQGQGQQEDLLTVREVAQQLRVDDTTVRRWIKHGILEAITLPARGTRNVYRIRTSALDAILHEQQGGQP